MRRILTVLFIPLCSLVSGQEIIHPSAQVMIGNKTHTNRDYLHSSHVDRQGNIILVGNTENDFTFNDIKIIKLDQNLEEIWQKEITFQTRYSFDRVHWSHIDENDNIILLCKSLFASDFETLFVVVLDTNGNLLWQLPFSELEHIDYGVHPSQILANINESGNLELAYTNLGLGKDEHLWVYEISDTGQIVNESRYDSLFGFNLYPTTGIEYENSAYYSITRGSRDQEPYALYNLIKAFDNTLTKFPLDFISEEELGFISRSENQDLLYNEDGGLIWFVNHDFYLNAEMYQGYSIYYINENGELINKIPTDHAKEKYVIGLSKDIEGNLVVISNDKNKETEEELRITLHKYAPSGDLIYTKTYDQDIWGYTTFFSDSNINIYTEEGTMLVLDYDLNLKEEITFKSTQDLGYNPTNIHFSNGYGFMTGTIINSMYEGSDYYGQLDFSVKKVSESVEIQDYKFSGEGTSKTWINWLKKNQNGEYVVHITDKLGPDNLFIGGSRSKEYSSNYYFDADLNQMRVYEDIPRNEWRTPLSTEVAPFSLDGAEYHYTFDQGTKQFTLTKSGNILWTKTWSYNNASLLDFNVNSKGNLIFRGSLNYGHTHFLATLSIDGDFTSIDYEGRIHFMKVLDNDWIFTHTDRLFIIYSPNLELISRKASHNTATYENPNYTPSLQVGNRVLVSTSSILASNFDKTETRAYDQYGNLERTFLIQGNLRPRYTILDNNDLIILTDDGRQVEHGFSWSIAVLNKFENFVGGTLPNYDKEDFDGDGVPNAQDRCENSPTGYPVNEYGCDLYQIGNNEIAVQTIGESCFGKTDGEIKLTAAQSLNYNATLLKDGIEIESKSFKDQVSFQELQGGNYKVCVTVAEISDYNKCFYLEVDAIEKLYVNSKVSADKRTLQLELKGGEHYTIKVNDSTFTTLEHSIDIPLNVPFSSIKVMTEKECQGVFEQNIISSSKTIAYPNPSDGKFTIYLGKNITQKIPFQIFTTDGMLLREGEIVPIFGNLDVDISHFSDGRYYYIIEVNKAKIPYAILKQ